MNGAMNGKGFNAWRDTGSVGTWQLVLRDGLALFCALSAVCWAVGTLGFAMLWASGWIRVPTPPPQLWWALGAFVAGSGGLLVWRRRLILSTLRSGNVTKGKVVWLPATIRLPMVYSYSYQRRDYRKYVYLPSQDLLKKFERKATLQVVVHPRCPRRAFVIDLFFSGTT